MGNVGKVCNTCSLLLLTFFDFDSALPLLHFSLSWALLPSSWEMDLPLGPDPISNDISKKIFPFALIGAGLGPCI